ncbi:Rv3235 family protein [Streptomyces sp. NPDC058307]|uniref:Rv3235 family protein n=1 Tax=Streptomyces sp. NPDC058307 TaxID=3346439 RepID=UPI0036EA1783
MNKVMTRAQHHPGTRPPARHDSRRPGGTPPRTPGGSTPRTAPGDGRPPSSPGTGPRARTGPTDSRPHGTPGPIETTTGATRRDARSGSTTASTHGATAGTTTASTAAGTTTVSTPSTAAGTTTVSTPSTPVGTPTPGAARRSTPRRRPLVPQPRPTDLFADLLLAVLSGQRPVHSMLRHTAGRAYDELARLAERGPLRTRGTRPVVRDIGYYVPREGAVEAFARIGAGDQLRAMAFRLEQGKDLRWRCTAVELGGPRAPRPDGD